MRYFPAVAESRHFSRAADQLHVVQAAVSQQISRLERELGVRLFHRDTRNVSLTAEGTAFLGHARHIITAVERAADAARDARRADRVLRVGTGSGLGDLLGAVLEELGRTHPDLSIEMTRLKEPERLRGLAAGRLGAAVVHAVRTCAHRAKTFQDSGSAGPGGGGSPKLTSMLSKLLCLSVLA